MATTTLPVTLKNGYIILSVVDSPNNILPLQPTILGTGKVKQTVASGSNFSVNDIVSYPIQYGDVYQYDGNFYTVILESYLRYVETPL
jgi:hypothetical protein